MVDITAKAQTLRQAKVSGIVQLDIRTLELIEKGRIAKGNVLTTAKIAGIMAAKAALLLEKNKAIQENPI